MRKLMQQIGVKRVKAYTADGTSTQTSASVDLQTEGADGIVFVTSFQTAAADNILKAQASDDDSTFADITGAVVAPGASDEVQFVEVVSPGKRYVRASCARGTTTILGDIYALLFRLRDEAYDNTTAGTIAGVSVNG